MKRTPCNEGASDVQRKEPVKTAGSLCTLARMWKLLRCLFRVSIKSFLTRTLWQYKSHLIAITPDAHFCWRNVMQYFLATKHFQVAWTLIAASLSPSWPLNLCPGRLMILWMYSGDSNTDKMSLLLSLFFSSNSGRRSTKLFPFTLTSGIAQSLRNFSMCSKRETTLPQIKLTCSLNVRKSEVVLSMVPL